VSDRGKRAYLQDRSALSLSLATAPSEAGRRYACIGLYDGHAGELSADYLQQHLHTNIEQELVRTAPQPQPRPDPDNSTQAAPVPMPTAEPAQPPPVETPEAHSTRVRQCLLEGFKRTERDLCALLQQRQDGSGSCALLALIDEQSVWIAHVGDSKAVLGRIPQSAAPASAVAPAGQSAAAPAPLQCIQLTTDHTSVLAAERRRIEKAGGSVDSEGRINGAIGVSRSLGDRRLKPPLSSKPDLARFPLRRPDQFLLLGSDGVWGAMSPAEAVEFVQRELAEQKEQAALRPARAAQTEAAADFVVRRTCERLLRELVLLRAVKDNVTVTLVVFEHPPE
jgi:integrin-linked kinase-associated serine/threonine phosphatase 2C